MNAPASDNRQWMVSARTRGELLAASVRMEGIELVLIAPGASDRVEDAEGWLRDLISMARETAAEPSAGAPIPPLLHHLLTGLLFSHAELWNRMGEAAPFSMAFVRTATEVAFGWVGDATPDLWIDDHRTEVEWVRIRDHEGREAFALAVDAAHRVRLHSAVLFELSAGPATASLDAVWVPEVSSAPTTIARIVAGNAPEPAFPEATPAAPARAHEVPATSAPVQVAPAAPAPAYVAAAAPIPVPVARVQEPVGSPSPAPDWQVVYEAAESAPVETAVVEPPVEPRRAGFWSKLFGWMGKRREPRAPAFASHPAGASDVPVTVIDMSRPPEDESLAAEGTDPAVAERGAIEPAATPEALPEWIPPTPEPAELLERTVPTPSRDPRNADDLLGALAASTIASLETMPPVAPPVEPSQVAAPPRREAADGALLIEGSALESESLRPSDPPALPRTLAERLGPWPAAIENSAPAFDAPVIEARSTIPAEPAVVARAAPPMPFERNEAVVVARPAPPPMPKSPPSTPAPLEASVAEVATPSPPVAAAAPPVAAPPIAAPPVAAAPQAVVAPPAPSMPATAPPTHPEVPASMRAASALEREPAPLPMPDGPDPWLNPADTDPSMRAPRERVPLRPAWPVQESTAALPLWKRPWLWGMFVVVLFAAGWLLGGVQNDRPVGDSTALSRTLRAIGLGGARFDVAVTSRPVGAWIQVDGKDLARRTPARIELTPGKHQVMLSFADLGGAGFDVQGARGDKLTLDGALWGSLTVYAGDSGIPVAVGVDGVDHGLAPVTVDSLMPGAHDVRFSGPGLAPWGQTVQVRVKEGAQMVARPVTSPATGVLDVRGTWTDAEGVEELTGATVWIDGEKRGVTPLTLELPRGPHSVRIESRGEGAPVQVIDLPGGNQRFANFELGIGNDRPTMQMVGDPVRVSLEQPVTVSAVVQGMTSAEVREMWLHVRQPDGAWRRYQMTMMKANGGVVGVTVFPNTLLDSKGQTLFYCSATSQTGDDSFTEIQAATELAAKK